MSCRNGITVPCPICEKDIDVPFYYDPGEKETWGYYGGSPYIPPSIELEDDIECLYCWYRFGKDETEALKRDILYSERNQMKGEDDY